MKKIVLPLVLAALLTFQVFPKGEWELGFHYSYWSIDIIGPIIEDSIGEGFDEYDVNKGDLNFDSDGNNLGFEVRYFPGGRNSAFSLGLSYEKNNFKGSLAGTYEETDNLGNRAVVSADGSFDLRPHSFNFSIRWDLWPSSRVHPYIGLGIGIGPLNGDLRLRVTTTTYIGNQTFVEEETEEKTLQEILDDAAAEGEEFPLGFFPIVHLHFGFRGEIAPNIYVLAEAAVYDGIIFRGGLAFRF
jgi:hypothetical protein